MSDLENEVVGPVLRTGTTGTKLFRAVSSSPLLRLWPNRFTALVNAMTDSEHSSVPGPAPEAPTAGLSSGGPIEASVAASSSPRTNDASRKPCHDQVSPSAYASAHPLPLLSALPVLHGSGHAWRASGVDGSARQDEVLPRFGPRGAGKEGYRPVSRLQARCAPLRAAGEDSKRTNRSHYRASFIPYTRKIVGGSMGVNRRKVDNAWPTARPMPLASESPIPS